MVIHFLAYNENAPERELVFLRPDVVFFIVYKYVHEHYICVLVLEWSSRYLRLPSFKRAGADLRSGLPRAVRQVRQRFLLQRVHLTFEELSLYCASVTEYQDRLGTARTRSARRSSG